MRSAETALRAMGPGIPRAFVVLCLLLGLTSPSRAEPPTLTVDIAGVAGDLLTNVRAFLTITELAGSSSLTADRIRRAHRRAPEEIRRALQPFGHYQPTVRARLTPGDSGFVARYDVEPGPRVHLEEVEITATGPGAEADALREVIADTPLAPDRPLNHAEYDTTKRRLIEAAVQAGYLDAEYRRSQLRVRPEAGTADIHLVLATGPAYYFGEVRVLQDILTDDLVARLVPVEAGDRLTSERLLDLQFALADTDFFQRVSVDVQRARATPHPRRGEAVQVPVVVRTGPRPPRQYSFGLGYGTDTGPRFSAEAKFRRINRRGHSIATDLLVSRVRQSLGTRYQIPIGNVRTDRMSFTGSYQRADLGDGISHKYTFGVSRDRLWHGWQRSLYTRYTIERFEFTDDTERTRFLTPGISLSRTRADDALRPRRGWSLFLDLHHAQEGVLSDTTFTQTRGRLQAVWGLGARLRLLGRVELGADFTDALSNLPASERFFAGGDRSVRGYAYQSLAPKNAEGDVIGGKYLATASLEADLRVVGNWGVAAFYDAGNADDRWPPETVAGAGAGLRWFSPIGTIRLDYAVPLDAPNRAYRIHFSMGPDL